MMTVVVVVVVVVFVVACCSHCCLRFLTVAVLDTCGDNCHLLLSLLLPPHPPVMGGTGN